jgi:hypothetical protein
MFKVESERFFLAILGCGDALPEHGRARLPSELEISLGGIQLSHGKFIRLRNTRKSLKIAKSAPLTGNSFKISFLLRICWIFLKLSTSFLIFFFSIRTVNFIIFTNFSHPF